MARYIDADIIDFSPLKNDFDRARAQAIIMYQPAEDVVPKSEVEKLKADVEVWKQNRFNIFQRLECYEMTRQKVAREIFEKIEKIILDNTYPDFNREHKPVNIWKATTGYDAFYELKNKYTEEKKDEKN